MLNLSADKRRRTQTQTPTYKHIKLEYQFNLTNNRGE